jgi:uncharacterized protein YktA (UPF0223 family)
MPHRDRATYRPSKGERKRLRRKYAEQSQRREAAKVVQETRKRAA